MKWTDSGTSADVEDRRGAGGTGLKVGLGGTIVLGLLSVVFGRNLFNDLGVSPSTQSGAAQHAPAQDSPEQKKEVGFVSFVLDDVQKTWARELPKAGKQYRNAKMVLFTDSVQSGCGNAQAAMGPFYCPQDEKVYIDLGFYNQLKTRFGAPGDFAQAYVIAHEVGHHVQNVLGIEGKMRAAQQSNPRARNELSVRLELQADCFAGIWSHSTEQRKILDPGDVDEAMNAASAVGDDRIQKQGRGQVNPETWTHGSSSQRMTWFKRGYQSGNIADCDTFASDAP